jgi:hypothetical protein
MQDVADRLANRVQLTTDGHKPYLGAVEDAFGADIDYAMLVKIYGEAGNAGPERKYSPGVCNGTRKHRIEGNPDRRYVSTSYVEKHNQSMRQHMRRFTRLDKLTDLLTCLESMSDEDIEAAVTRHFASV